MIRDIGALVNNVKKNDLCRSLEEPVRMKFDLVEVIFCLQ